MTSQAADIDVELPLKSGAESHASDAAPNDMDPEEAAMVFGEHLVNSVLAHEPLHKIQEILENGAPVWYENLAEGTSPLHAAAYTRNSPLAKLLIDKGAIWNSST
jgi:type IV protein arginine methyltransferase